MPEFPDAEYYDLLCRGPFELKTAEDQHYSLDISFRSIPTSAGIRGGSLEPGTCAFADRAVNSEEPRRIRIRDQSWEETAHTEKVRDVAVAIWMRSLFDYRLMILSQMISRSDYVVVLKVHNVGSYFQAETWEGMDPRYLPFGM